MAILTWLSNGSSAASPMSTAGMIMKVLISSITLSWEWAFIGGPIEARATPRPCPRVAVTTKIRPKLTITTNNGSTGTHPLCSWPARTGPAAPGTRSG